MEEIKIEKLSLDEFFKRNNIDASSLTNKEKLQLLKTIRANCRIDIDWEEYQYSKLVKEEKTKEVTEEYLNKIHNLELNQMNIQGYIGMVKYLYKEERKLKRKQVFQKVIGVFNGRKN